LTFLAAFIALPAVKRRARPDFLQDENSDPLASVEDGRNGRNGDLMDEDDLDQSRVSKSTPNKHNIKTSRIALSPTKINAVFKHTKAVSGKLNISLGMLDTKY
jgi:hypothetical protein